MAEAFGVATSAFAVFTLTLELLKIVKSVHRSMKLTQNVLKITSEVKIGLSITEKLLNEIEALSADAANDCGVSMCLERCRPRLKVLKEILQDITDTNSTNRKKVKRAFRMIALDKRLSEASEILKETVDSLSLGLLVFQLYESRMQSIKLSTMNEQITWIAAQQTKEVSSFAVSNDIQNSITNLSRSLTLLEAAIHQPSLSNAKVSPEKLVGSSRSFEKWHVGDRSESAIIATLTDDKLTTDKLQSLPHKSSSQNDTIDDSLKYNNGSTFLKASEIYSITHRRFDLLLGTLSLAYVQKRHRRVRKGEKNNSLQSWEVKINFSSSCHFDKGLLVRLWTNASGSYNLQQSLTVMHTVPLSDEIWTSFRCMDIVSIRKILMKGKYSVNTVDEYGRSLLSKACRRGRIDLARFLLDAGAISQGVDDFGRNALLYGFDTRGISFLGTDHSAIYNLLAEKCQLDPSEPDWNGRNFWHILCENVPLKKESFSWQSICNDFRYVLNEQDNRGRTSTFILSSNPKSDTEILRWHLNNKASISITSIDGLTCLHAAIASLEQQHQSYLITAQDLAGYPGMKSSYYYSDKDRENQRKKIELLIRKGANIFTASNQYGTPTDIARLTGNFSLWIEALKNSGFDPTRVLAADKKVPRHQHFLSMLQLARNLKRERRLRWQIFQNILLVSNNFDKERKYTTAPITPEWSCLPIYPFIACMGTYQEILSILKSVLREAILKDDHAEDQGELFSINMDIGGVYQTGFLHTSQGYLTASPLYQERYNSLDEHLETLAKIVSGDHTFTADTSDCETNRLSVDVINAAATLEYNCRNWLLPQRTGLMHAPGTAKETSTKMPGSWPA